MSCLTKKIFLFMVLSIVCNPTFAADDEGCSQSHEARVAECKGIEPHLAFQISRFALSTTLINSVSNTIDLSNALLEQFDMFKHNLNSEHERIYHIIVSYIKKKDVEITDLAKKDVIGYLDYLMTHFNEIYGVFEKVVKSPRKLCAENYKYDLEQCRQALTDMLHTTDDKLDTIDADKAFEHCFLNYRDADFIDNNFYSKSSDDTDISYDEKLLQIRRTNIIKSYYQSMMNIIIALAMEKLNEDRELFPTIVEYCRLRK